MKTVWNKLKTIIIELHEVDDVCKFFIVATGFGIFLLLQTIIQG